jgi:hypothetical protein
VGSNLEVCRSVQNVLGNATLLHPNWLQWHLKFSVKSRLGNPVEGKAETGFTERFKELEK